MGTAFVMLGTRIRASRPEQGPRIGPTTSGALSRRQTARDSEILGEFVSTLGERNVDWLRFEQFSDFWLDSHTAGLRAIAEFDGRRSGLFDQNMAVAAGELTRAVRAFFDVYDTETVSDSIMRDESWRTIGRAEADGEEIVPREEARLASQKRLRAGATEILKRRAALIAMLDEAFPSP